MSEYFRVLVIDGGGIRGIIPATILKNIEAKLPGRISDHFDMIVGTSTGGILACMYLCPTENNAYSPRFTAENALDFYLDYGPKIFECSFWHKCSSLGGISDEKYQKHTFRKLVQDHVGDTKMSDLIRPCVITAYDIERRIPHYFKQHKALNDPKKDFRVVDCALSTSAAPTYFEAEKIRSAGGTEHALVDGGVFANNPCMAAFVECEKLREGKPVFILSLGTGGCKNPYLWEKAKDFGKLQWIKPMFDILWSGASESTHAYMNQIFSDRPDWKYVRIDPKLCGKASSDMDNVKKENMETLRYIGEKETRNMAESGLMDKIVSLLTS